MKKTILLVLAIALFCMLIMASCSIFTKNDDTSSDGVSVTDGVSTEEATNNSSDELSFGDIPTTDDYMGDASLADSSSDENEVDFGFGQTSSSTTTETSSRVTSSSTTSSSTTSSKVTSSSATSSYGSVVVIPPTSNTTSSSASSTSSGNVGDNDEPYNPDWNDTSSSTTSSNETSSNETSSSATSSGSTSSSSTSSKDPDGDNWLPGWY